ncbi:hypothetical protein ANO14919_104750 [Xylariales sp. No.14919]|nr:hypothetical protein ANO14919_104750 [Xylariales sp. No.14919]
MPKLREAARVTLFGSRNASKRSFDPGRDIPNLPGKIVLITGIQEILAQGGGQSDRSEHEVTKVRFLDLSLTIFASLRKCAVDFLAHEQRLDILVLNAGIISAKVGMTGEGHEKHFGLNYLGRALFLRLLLPSMLSVAERRLAAEIGVVIVPGEGHGVAPAGGLVL